MPWKAVPFSRFINYRYMIDIVWVVTDIFRYFIRDAGLPVCHIQVAGRHHVYDQQDQTGNHPTHPPSYILFLQTKMPGQEGECLRAIEAAYSQGFSANCLNQYWRKKAPQGISPYLCLTLTKLMRESRASPAPHQAKRSHAPIPLLS